MKITLKLLRKLNACYDPRDVGFTKDLELTPLEFIEQFKDKVKSKYDVIWLLCRKQFISERDQRLFAVWCAREALKLIKEPDPRSVEACDVAERFANGEATEEERDAASAVARDAARDVARAVARDAASAVARDAARDAAWATAWATASAVARDAAWDAAWAVARDAAWATQIEQLKTYFND